MSDIVDRRKVLALIAAIDEQFRRANDEQSRLQDTLTEIQELRTLLSNRRSHLESVIHAMDALKKGEQLLGVPVPAQVAEGEELMYLGATPEESIRGRGHTSND
jgi:hypothetical protein